MEREVDSSRVFNDPGLEAVGLSRHIISSGVSFVHRIMDSLDDTLVSAGETRLSEMVELANLSAIIVDLSRFDAAPLIAFIAAKETDYGNETDGRVPC